MWFNIAFGTISAVGVVLTIYFGIKSSVLERQKKTLTWPQLQLIADATCFNLKKDGFIPDLILAPGSRGAILAELILNKFNRNIPAIVGISFMEFTTRVMPSIKDYFAFNIGKGWNIYIPNALNEFKDKKVLIVDDFCLTGEFFESLKAFMVKQGFKTENIKVFCAVITQVTKAVDRAPDYYHLITDDDNFYFPWGKANTG